MPIPPVLGMPLVDQSLDSRESDPHAPQFGGRLQNRNSVRDLS